MNLLWIAFPDSASLCFSMLLMRKLDRAPRGKANKQEHHQVEVVGMIRG